MTVTLTGSVRVLALCSALAFPMPCLGQERCSTFADGIDPATWNTSRSTLLGEAIGETFYAPDTIIKALTVWRPPNDRSTIGAHLYITGVDMAYTPPRPDAHQIILDGPTIHVYDSFPPGLLIEMRFDLDPPLVLPRRGLYAWMLQAENCNQGQPWIITANDTNPYPHGNYWNTRRASAECHLPDTAGGSEATDLIFKIEYCRETATPNRRTGWGSLKVLYR